MKRILKALAVLCIGFDVSAKTSVEINGHCFWGDHGSSAASSDSGESITFTIKNLGGQKNQFSIEVLLEGKDGTKTDCSDNFIFGLNNIYIQPNGAENIKLIPFFTEKMPEGKYLLRVINKNTKENVCVHLMDVKQPELGNSKHVAIQRKPNGMLHATVSSKN
ncbi:MAG: hypothetical protein LBJ96_04825 [Holosporaceae bacterium]|nr:hypothetical protein [Holosporaceae bacterium]